MDTGPTSLSADPVMPGICQVSHESISCGVIGITGPVKQGELFQHLLL